MPRYIYQLGKYDEKTYYDGEKLVGKSIQLVLNDFYGEPMKNFQVKVVGTYDNMETRISEDSLYVNQDFIEDIRKMDFDMEIAYADEFRREAEAMGMDPNTYNPVYEQRVGIYVNTKYDIDEVLKDINEETGLHFTKNISVEVETEGFFGYIAFVANVVSFLLLVIAFLNIVISSMNEVKSREWEFALKLSMGYTYKDIIKIFFVEKAINMAKSLLVSLTIVFIGCIGGTMIIDIIAGRYSSMLGFSLDIEYAILALMLVIIAAFSGVISAKNSIRNVEVAQVLKSGD